MHGLTVGRRGIDNRQISSTHQTEVQSPRNGRCRECQCIYIHLEFLQFLFGSHPEFLLFIDDHQPQIFKLDVFPQDAMRPNQHIHLPRFHFIQCGLLFLGRFKSIDIVYGNRKTRKSLRKRTIMLLSQNRCWHQNGDLLTVANGFKRRTHRHFCLSETHITANQTVHRLGRFHIAFCILHCFGLVRRILVKETRLQLHLHIIVGPKRKPLLRFPLGIQRNQLPRYVLDFLFGSLLLLIPLRTPQLVHAWECTVLSGVFTYFVQTVHRHIK